ncbi:adhesion G protein-coupled receptor L3-like isoform X1 [Stylophora pistillata]|uniref:adhesion G protein-coupled receptor L3-like isoform X1 n=1 Tax=Stylophora pistillata TaxID=50429 RepID=UPI000C0432B7|nr:adhesion G protein-coupled receptor L3-like isoform X1 [Stylophora pistillata]
MSPSIFGRSGQFPPLEPPADITVVRVNAKSVNISWTPYKPTPPRSVDGHYIYLWQGVRTNKVDLLTDHDFSGEIVEIPDHAITVKVVGGNVVTGVVTGLTPWTIYTVLVRGYNNAGLGPTSFQDVFVRTLDAKDSYYILTLRITSENFSEDLKDRISNRFKALKENVTTEITKLYSKSPWFKSATVLSFSPGSVQAEIQMQTASPNISFIEQVVSQADNLGNFSLDRNSTKLQNQAGIQNVTIQASHLTVNVTGRFVINCTVIGGPPDLLITWSKGGNIVGLSHRTKVETNGGYSRLTVRSVVASDEGVYVCQAGKGSQIGTASVAIQVIPVLRISPRIVTRRVGGEASFSCSVVRGVRQGASVFMVEVTTEESEFLNNPTNYTATNLEIPDRGEIYTRKFVCVMRSQEGSLMATSEVASLIIIKPEVLQCREELLAGVLWAATAAGHIDVKPCPPGAKGKVSRFCGVSGKWENANFVDCSSREFLRLGNEVEAVTEGFQTNFTAKQILSELVNATQSNANNTQRSPEIFGGDLVIAVNVLVKVADYNAEQGNVSEEKAVKSFVQVASNLLEPINRVTWQELENLGDSRSRILVKAVDDYGLGVAATFTGSNKSIVVQATNLLVRIDRVQEDNPLRSEGLKVAYNKSSIHLPAEAFSSSPDSRAITSVLLTLNDVLPLDKETEDKKQAVTANTTIVSSTVYPRPQNVFKRPVKIVLENKGINVLSGVDPKRECVFWRPGGGGVWQTSGCRLVAEESNINITTCECNHLTVFASLMDPHDAPINEAHKKALKIVAIVGCSISLLAVVVTMVVTVIFWRAVKSPRAKVLLNLCAAIAICCILVIGEGSARNNETGCTIMAALLHYFLLTLFCWMLCEGVLLYILLVKVFGGGADDKVKYFYLLGWGFPAVIVAISLGATQAVGYGSSKACWLDVESGLVWAFIGPAVLVILVNIVVFILVIRQMMGTQHIQNKTQIEKVKAGVKASAVVLPLLGVTWLFGLLSINTSTIGFQYVFVIFNSLQGLMIFIFHCLLNKQIQDAIKRIRDKSSSGASTTPKTKPSPAQNPKNAINITSKAKKKWSNKAQKDYEMVEHLRSQSDSTLPSKNAINDTRISDEPENPEMLLQEKLPLYENKEGSPLITCAQEKITQKDSVVETAEQNTYPDSLVTNDTRKGSSMVPSNDDILRSKDGITNHIYEKPPEDYVLLLDKTPQRDQAYLNFEEEPSKEHGDKISNDGVPSRIYENSLSENSPSDEIDSVITQEEDAFVLEDEPSIQGATPSESNDKLAGAITVKQVELREVPEDVKSDEDFDIKMAEIRVKVDTVQNAADAFRSHSRKSSTETRVSNLSSNLVQFV